MNDYSIVLTWQAIYDIVDIAEYIEMCFGKQHADDFQGKIKRQLELLGLENRAFPKTKVWYQEYQIYKKVFSPSIIFYVIMEETKEIHVLRILREERNWKRILKQTDSYTYPDQSSKSN